MISTLARAQTIALGLLLLPWSAAAQAPVPVNPAALIKYAAQPADRVTPLPGTARPYAQAKAQLARGEPAAALKLIKGQSGGILADRVALLRGDAWLALGKKKKAQAAYLKAIEVARVESVALHSARGLIDVHRQLKDRKGQLAYVDALLTVKRISRRSNLLLSRAQILMALGRNEEAAAQAWTILLDYPTGRSARAAEPLLQRLKKRGIKMPASNSRIELARIRNLIGSRAWVRAEKAINALEKAKPRLRRALDMKRAKLYEKRRYRGDEMEILLKLRKEGLTADDGAAILYRLGKLAMAKDLDSQAIGYFDELRTLYPKSKLRKTGQYLAAWIPYNAGQHATAVDRMLAFASENLKSSKRDEALWWAGWAAYLGKDPARAQLGFEQLIKEHPTSTLVPHARYWIGRIHHKAGESDLAKESYRAVLKKAPLSYYGFWSAERLGQLGETTVLSAPPPSPAPASMRQVLARLGPGRPSNLDRAVQLHAANLDAEALEELSEAERFLRRVKDTEGRTMIADMLTQLGAHHMAFRTATRITADGGALQTGQDWAWRAWRHAYPSAFARAVKLAEKAHDVDGHLVLSIMRTESHYRPWVRSHAGARGLMQLMPNTAKLIGKKAEGGRRHAARFKDPNSNVWLGTWYLKQLLARFDGQLAAAIGAYNAGPGAMDRWVRDFHDRPLDEFVERIPYRETRRYVRRVLETLMVYRRLYGGETHTLLSTVRPVKPPETAVSF